MPNAIFDFLGITANPTNLDLPPLGTLLCDPSFIIATVTTQPGVPFTVPVTPECIFVGFPICVQAGSVDALGNIRLTNALDATHGTY